MASPFVTPSGLRYFPTRSPSPDGHSTPTGKLVTVLNDPLTLNRRSPIWDSFSDFPSGKKENVKSKILTIWNRLEEKLRGSSGDKEQNEKAKREALDALEVEIDPHIPGFEKMYKNALTSPLSIEKVALFKRDLELSARPVSPTPEGVTRDSIIVQHKDAKDRECKYVVKSSVRRELLVNRILQTIIKDCTIPKITGIDFKKKKGEHESFSREITMIDEKTFSDLEMQYKSLMGTCGKKIAEIDYLIFMEFIDGKNIVDLLVGATDNEVSREDLEKIFKNFGKLGILDLVTGNLDRFFKPDVVQGEWSLGLPANLENLLIGSETKVIHPIDNDVSPDVLESTENKNGYLDLLKTCISSLKPHSKPIDLVKKFQEGFIEGINQLFEAEQEAHKGSEWKGKKNKIEKILTIDSREKTFDRGLAKFVEIGMKEMHDEIANMVKQNGQEISELMQYLKVNDPDYCDYLTKALEIFHTD